MIPCEQHLVTEVGKNSILTGRDFRENYTQGRAARDSIPLRVAFPVDISTRKLKYLSWFKLETNKQKIKHWIKKQTWMCIPGRKINQAMDQDVSFFVFSAKPIRPGHHPLSSPICSSIRAGGVDIHNNWTHNSNIILWVQKSVFHFTKYNFLCLSYTWLPPGGG